MLFHLNHPWGGDLVPRQIVTGLTVDYNKHYRLQFGKYVQVNEYHENTMQEQATGAIYPRPTGNDQGVYFFMSLSTGRRLNRKSFTPLPLPKDVINVVHLLARRNPRGLGIQDRYRRLFLGDEDGARDDPNDST